jgi:hypothetical protein
MLPGKYSKYRDQISIGISIGDGVTKVVEAYVITNAKGMIRMPGTKVIHGGRGATPRKIPHPNRKSKKPARGRPNISNILKISDKFPLDPLAMNISIQEVTPYTSPKVAK